MHDYKRLFATHATMEAMQEYANNKPATLRHISGNEYALLVPMENKAWADKFVEQFNQDRA